VLTRHFAQELGPRGITVNTIAAGAVETDFSFSDGLLRDHEQVQQRITSVPAARALCGRRRHRWGDRRAAGRRQPPVTGQRIEVSGGVHL